MTRRRRQIVTALVLGGLVLALGWGLWVIRPVLAPFLIAVAMAYLVAPLVNALSRRGLSRGWSILAVYSVLVVAIGLALWKVLPTALKETRRLAEAIPLYSSKARGLVDGLQQRVRETGLHPGIRDVLDRLITDLEVRSIGLLERVLDINTIRHAATLLGSVLLAPFLAFYLLRDMEKFKERFVRSLPRRYRQDILGLLRSLDRVLAGFVRGQILLSLAVGALATIATALLGLRYAVLLGIWAGFTEFVPYVGPILGGVPAVLAGMTVSPLLALETAAAFVLVQQIENAFLAPKIMGESIGLHPLVVMMSILAGGYLMGGWGLILALPMAGLIRVLWSFLVAQLTQASGMAVLGAPAARPEPLWVGEAEPNSEDPKRENE